MPFRNIEVIRNYNKEELLVNIKFDDNRKDAQAHIVSSSGETIEHFTLSEGENIIPLKEFLYKNYSFRIANDSNVVHYAL